MDRILQQLAELLLKAIPTFLIVVVLHFYLKSVFFKPLEKVLHKRYEATEGARKNAAESLEQASAKTTQYETALRNARAEVYHSQEQSHKKLQETHAAQLLEARQRADALVKQAKGQIAAEREAAKVSLATDSELLANQIAESVLRRNAA
jgi:F-type H+-transporting ATPase subunit b